MSYAILAFEYVLFAVAMYAIGWMRGARRVHKAVFDPWRESLKAMAGADRDYWVRGRDYDAAWFASVEAQRMGQHFEPHAFSDPLPAVVRGRMA